MRPIIGITAGRDDRGDIFLRRRYCDAVTAAGGEPVILPCGGSPDMALRLCHGLILSGGGDISPSLCGIVDYEPTLLFEPCPLRDEYELALVRLAYTADLPTLGICRGIQVMNVALGGTLHFHINAHRQKRSREQPSHAVTLFEGTRLRELAGTGELHVNSFHHQAAAGVAEGLRISAVSEDGIIEGLEARDKRFFIGVQWHPEHMETHAARVLFAALCAAAKRVK